MLKTTIDEVDSAFQSAKNLNAALKTFLKREGTQGGPAIGAFAKNFRNAASAGKPAAIRQFVESNYPQKELHFMAVVRYAHPEVVEVIVSKIFEKHAEAFNSTYEKAAEGITIVNEAMFSEIVADVLKMIETNLKDFGVDSSNFMRNSILASVFDSEVLPEVLKRVASV